MMAGRSAPHRGCDGRARLSLHSGIRPAVTDRLPVPSIPHHARPDRPGWRKLAIQPGNQRSISRAADSGESDPCTRLSWVIKGQVTADCAGRGLLDRVGSAGDLAKRGDRPRALHDGRHDGSRGDELQQRPEERLALVLGVVPAGEVVADVLEFEGRDVRPLPSIRPRISPTRRRLTPSGLIKTRVRSVAQSRPTA